MTRMIKMEVAELSGPALRYAVAIAEGWDFSAQLDRIAFSGFCPDTDWANGGPLIDKYRIDLSSPPSDTSQAGWDAHVDDDSCLNWSNGETPLIAACRAVVQAQLGDAVQVPAELVDGGGV